VPSEEGAKSNIFYFWLFQYKLNTDTIKTMGQAYRRTKKTVSLINYHFIFCPCYRRKVLIDQVEERFKQLVKDICQENGWDILVMEVMPDHCLCF
jgi:putative transposase